MKKFSFRLTGLNKMGRIIAIIQARMGSTRLPGKVLMEIENKPLLWHVITRTRTSKYIDDVVVATSNNKKDDVIEAFARKYGFNLFRGSEEDCLDRYFEAAKKFRGDIIVRITADCPLICPEIIDKIISEYLKGSYDYVSNTISYTYPDGCDTEVFSFKVLEKAWKEAKDPLHREHVTPYMRDSTMFRIKNVENERPVNPDEYKWSVDRPEDLNFVREVYRHLYKENRIFNYKQIMKLLERHPEIKKINEKTIMNEGYYKSILKTKKIKPKRIKIKKSNKLKKEAKKIIPDHRYSEDLKFACFPMFLEKFYGSHVEDVDGNEYIDYEMASGTVILGHNYPAVSNQIKEMLKKGNLGTFRLEVELAQILCEIIRWAQMVSFTKSPQDAISGAIATARTYTGKDKVAWCNVWHNWYISNRRIPQDIKELTLTFEYNKVETLERIFEENKNQIACVIMETVGAAAPKDAFLQNVKDLTHKNGAILIFDEAFTGFRFSLGGAQEYFNVVPDLACFGKAMGNGFPISAIVGRKDVMKLCRKIPPADDISFCASIATIKELKEKNVIRHLWEQGRKLKDGYNVLAREYGLENTQCIGYPPKTEIVFEKEGGFDSELGLFFQRECLKRGVLFTGIHNVSLSHTNKDIDYTLRVYRTVLEIIKNKIKSKKSSTLMQTKKG